MDIHITGRHVKITKPMAAYVRQKVEKAQKYFDHIIWAQAVLFVEKRAQKAEIVIHAPRQTFRVVASAADLYAAVDLASDKIDAQLKKFKEKLRDHHRGEDGGAKAAAAAQGAASQAGQISFSVVRRPVAPMTPEQAVGEMESLGYTFYPYQDRQTGHIQVVYRRTDETYGILQPVRKSGR